MRCIPIAALLTLSALPLAAQARFTVGAQPALTIDATTADGSTQFTMASWATPLRDGRVVVVDGLDAQLPVFSRAGARTAAWGRRGGGPGEYQSPLWAAPCAADSLYVWDERAGAISVLGADGRYARQFRVLDALGARQVACGGSGRVALISMPERGGPRPDVVSGRTAEGGEYEVQRMQAALLLTDRTGTITARIPGVRWAELIVGRLSPTSGMGASFRPLAPRTSFVFAGEALVVAEGDSARLSWYSEKGELLRRLNITEPPVRTTAAVYERAIAGGLVGAPPQVLEAFTAFVRAVPPPATVPPFNGLVPSTDGLAWLVLTPDGNPTTRLRAYRASGDVAATLEIPAALTVFAIGPDFVLGRMENEDGEHRIVRYALRR
jgi:hypothetical protein